MKKAVFALVLAFAGLSFSDSARAINYPEPDYFYVNANNQWNNIWPGVTQMYMADGCPSSDDSKPHCWKVTVCDSVFNGKYRWRVLMYNPSSYDSSWHWMYQDNGYTDELKTWTPDWGTYWDDARTWTTYEINDFPIAPNETTEHNLASFRYTINGSYFWVYLFIHVHNC